GYVYLYKSGKDKSISYDRVSEDKKLGGYKDGKIRVPTVLGNYILRWETNGREVLAETTFDVVDAEIKISAPTEAPAGPEIQFSLSGPDGLDGYVYIYAKGRDKHISYTRVSANNQGGYKTGKIRLPITKGSY